MGCLVITTPNSRTTLVCKSLAEAVNMAVNYFQLALIVLVLFIAAGDSLRCYDCTSEDSEEDCKSKMESITCPSGTSQCLIGILTCTQGNIEKTIYYKKCNAPNTSSCGSSGQDTPKCTTSQGSWGFATSEVCCTGDNCNSGSSHSINQVMLGICIAFAFWALGFIQ